MDSRTISAGSNRMSSCGWNESVVSAIRNAAALRPRSYFGCRTDVSAGESIEANSASSWPTTLMSRGTCTRRSISVRSTLKAIRSFTQTIAVGRSGMARSLSTASSACETPVIGSILCSTVVLQGRGRPGYGWTRSGRSPPAPADASRRQRGEAGSRHWGTLRTDAPGPATSRMVTRHMRRGVRTADRAVDRGRVPPRTLRLAVTARLPRFQGWSVLAVKGSGQRTTSTRCPAATLYATCQRRGPGTDETISSGLPPADQSMQPDAVARATADNSQAGTPSAFPLRSQRAKSRADTAAASRLPRKGLAR